MAEDNRTKAAEVGFDLTKQFLTLAIAGIAFVVGLSFNKPGIVPTTLFWITVGIFSLSVAAGLLFLSHAVAILHRGETIDLFSIVIRFLVTAQILLVAVGFIFLIPFLRTYPPNTTNTTGSDTQTIHIEIGPDKKLTYPIEPDKDVTIEIDGAKVNVQVTKP